MMTADAWIMFVLGFVLGATIALCFAALQVIRDSREVRAEGRRPLETLQSAGTSRLFRSADGQGGKP